MKKILALLFTLSLFLLTQISLALDWSSLTKIIITDYEGEKVKIGYFFDFKVKETEGESAEKKKALYEAELKTIEDFLYLECKGRGMNSGGTLELIRVEIAWWMNSVIATYNLPDKPRILRGGREASEFEEIELQSLSQEELLKSIFAEDLSIYVGKKKEEYYLFIPCEGKDEIILSQ